MVDGKNKSRPRISWEKMEAQCSGVAVAVCVWIPALLQVGLGHVSFTDVDKFPGASSI